MRTTLWIMLVIGMGFWASTLLMGGYNWAILIFSAVLVTWCVFHLMTDEEEEE